MDDIRDLFEKKMAMDRAAQMIAERELATASPLVYITVEDVSLDDDPNFPTVVIMARENWQGNCEDHTLVLPLHEFAAQCKDAWGPVDG